MHATPLATKSATLQKASLSAMVSTTTAPTARLDSFRALLHTATALEWDIQYVDIKTAFLHGVLPETEILFMEQPPGFEEPDKEDWVVCLMKSIYDMKQASRIWNQTFNTTVVGLDDQLHDFPFIFSFSHLFTARLDPTCHARARPGAHLVIQGVTRPVTPE